MLLWMTFPLNMKFSCGVLWTLILHSWWFGGARKLTGDIVYHEALARRSSSLRIAMLTS
jgi:hypothetical protein